ncbi:MAG: tRNA pseudouridine(38-40) synthase TruA [Campylobacterota bacterium]|nr:tRNA pseudouridine(38-40) synthase TruA [Campylobacterota bacterium]
MTIKLTIMYDGSKYNGSQKQPEKNTVEDCLIEALVNLNIHTKLIFSGRTDKDVHASGQVISCAIPNFWNDLMKLKNSLNHHLPSSIRIRHIKIVDDNFHARYSAKKRTYHYIVTTTQPNPFESPYITYHKHINPQLIQEAIQRFIGVHDFEYFCKAGGGTTTTVRQIYSTRFHQHKDKYIFTFTAKGFLRSQIRLMMEFLFKVSDGKLNVDQLVEQLNKKSHYNFKPAPANGLYLAKIIY